MEEKRQTVCRKIKVIPVLREINPKWSDEEIEKKTHEEVNRVYKYLREGMKAQNIAMNQYMSALFTAKMMGSSKDDRKELNLLYARVSDSKKGSAYTEDILFAKGLGSPSVLSQKVKQDFGNACKKGLMYGRISLPTYRDTNPLLVHVNYVAKKGSKDKDNRKITTGMYHNYESHNELLHALKKGSPDIYIDFANNITFKVVFGNWKKSHEMRNVFQYIFEDYYIVQGSSIQFGKDGKDIMLNLTLSIPVQEHDLDENVVVGVDIGTTIPAVCALNCDKYSRASIGKKDDFLRVRTKIQNQRRTLQRNLKNTSGGHGRKKKLKSLDKFSEYESNFVKTYNHMISSHVVNFALRNNAKYINMEYLKGYDKSNFILRNWSYYQLQTQIEYKASMHGIEVRYINPAYTSQVCSVCGQYHEGDRSSQAKFCCSNPDCDSHTIYKNKSGNENFNADFNGARNIAQSTLFITEEIEKIKKKDAMVNKLIKDAKEYYNIQSK